MSEYEIKNAVIESAIIDIGDRDMLTAWLMLDYGGSGQGFGGYVLLPGEGWAHRAAGERGPNYAGVFIDQCMRIAGVGQWSQLPGKTIRVKASHGRVHAIGHIVKDKWFCPSEALESLAAPTPEDSDV